MKKLVFIVVASVAGIACQEYPQPSQSPGPESVIGIDSTWRRLVGSKNSEMTARLHSLPLALQSQISKRLPNGLGVGLNAGALAATSPSWTLTESSPVSTSAAVLVMGSMPDATKDRVVIEGAGSPAHFIGVVSNIYSNAPLVTASPAMDAGIDGSALAVSLDGSITYAVSSAGTVYAVKTSDATFAWTHSLGASVSWSTPWVEYSNNFLYLADTSGRVTALDAATGTIKFTSAAVGSAIHSSPTFYNGVVYVGADDGSLYRLDGTTGALIGSATSLCLIAGSCTANDQIWSSATIDTLNNKLLLPVNKRVLQLDVSATGCNTGAGACSFTTFPVNEASFASHRAVIYGTAFIDNPAGGFVYLGFDNRLWRAPYNNGITGPFARATTADPTGILRGASDSNPGYPRSSPIVFNNSVFIGDGGGYMHSFATSAFNETAVKGFANAGAVPGVNGPNIDSTPFIDLSGNIYFGVMNPNAPQGEWVSLPQSFTSDTFSSGAATHLRVEITAETTAGTSVSMTVVALDQFNNPSTGYTGTVHFTNSVGNSTLPSDYTFNGGDAGVHTFAGVILRTPGTSTITGTDTGTGSINGSASVIVSVGPVATFQVVPSATTIASGNGVSLDITALDAGGNVVTNYTGTVHFTSSDAQATLPSDYTFTAAEMGHHNTGYATVLRTQGSQTVTVTDTSSGANGSTTITVTQGGIGKLQISPSVATTQPNMPFSVTVTAQDSGGSTVTSYTGTIHFYSSDGAATLPADYIFTAGDMGVHTFNGVVLRTLGSQTVSAQDTSNGLINGTAMVQVTTGSSAGGFTVTTGSTTVSSGSGVGLDITAIDSLGNTNTSYTGTIHFTSTDPKATLPADYTFTPADMGKHSTGYATVLRTAGQQTVTVTDTSTGATGSVTITVTGGSISQFGVVPSVSSTTPGMPFSVTITAQDAGGGTVTSYVGTVHFYSTDGAATLPPNYTFTAGDMGVHTFSGVVLQTYGQQYVLVQDTANGTIGGQAPVQVTTGSSSGGFVVTTGSTTVASGNGVGLDITAIDSLGNTNTGYVGTIHFTSSDPMATLPADYTFTGANMGKHSTGYATVLRTDGTQTVTVTDLSTGATGSVTITVTQGAAASFTVMSSTGTPTSNVPFTITVSAKDPGGTAVTNYTGTVEFLSSDGAATLPANYTFTPADNGVHTFQVTLRTTGSQNVLVRDSSNGFANGTVSVNVQ